MNRKYIYIDGKVIVEDEKGDMIQYQYYDNLEEVLVQDNLIETLENRIVELEKKSNEFKKSNRKHYIPLFMPFCLLLTIVGAPIMVYFLGGTDIYTSFTDTIFGNMSIANLISLTLSSVMLLPATLFEIFRYYDYKILIKEEKGINSELEFLEKQLVCEKEKLENLKSAKTRNNENKEFRVVEVDDLERLKIFKSWLNLYFDLGYNEEKYYKYYQQGKLESKLSKYYNETGIEIAKEYLEEKESSFVKIKKLK